MKTSAFNSIDPPDQLAEDLKAYDSLTSQQSATILSWLGEQDDFKFVNRDDSFRELEARVGLPRKQLISILSALYYLRVIVDEFGDLMENLITDLRSSELISDAAAQNLTTISLGLVNKPIWRSWLPRGARSFLNNIFQSVTVESLDIVPAGETAPITLYTINVSVESDDDSSNKLRFVITANDAKVIISALETAIRK